MSTFMNLIMTIERNWKEEINGEQALGNLPNGREAKCERTQRRKRNVE